MKSLELHQLKLPVSLALCGPHDANMGWPKPRLGFAKGKCWACGRLTVLSIVGEPGSVATNGSGRLEPDEAGKIWYIPVEEEAKND